MAETKFIKSVDDVQIFLNEKGFFECRIADKKYERSSLAQLEAVIVKRRVSVTLQKIYSSSIRRRNEVEIVEFTTQSKKARTKDGDLIQRYDYLYSCTPEQIEEIDKLIAKTNKLNDQWNELIESLTYVNASNFEDLKKAEKA